MGEGAPEKGATQVTGLFCSGDILSHRDLTADELGVQDFFCRLRSFQCGYHLTIKKQIFNKLFHSFSFCWIKVTTAMGGVVDNLLDCYHRKEGLGRWN